MLVNGINNLNNKTYAQNFTHVRRRIFDENGNFLYNADTCLFRHDLAWDYFVLFLNRKYKNTDNVNVIVHACSQGEEAYTLAAELDYMLGENADKFYPIKARDIDKENIQIAQRGIYTLIRSEYDALEFYLGKKDANKYFRKIANLQNTVGADPKIFKNKINFKVSNIFDDFDEISKPNTVLMFRNCMPYLSAAERKKLIHKLSETMDKSSLLIIGDYDVDECHLHCLLKNAGFIETEIKNVFLPPKVRIYLDSNDNVDNKNKFYDYADLLKKYF